MIIRGGELDEGGVEAGIHIGAKQGGNVFRIRRSSVCIFESSWRGERHGTYNSLSHSTSHVLRLRCETLASSTSLGSDNEGDTS